jgi:histidine triad (HIT) family protein
MKNCTICKIVNGDIESLTIFENKNIIAFLPLEMEVYGHTIIAPKKHYVTFLKIPSDLVIEIHEGIKLVMDHYKNIIDVDSFNLLSANGQAAQQSILHFHFHVLPRKLNDNVDAWPKLPGCTDNRNSIYKKLKF